MKLKTPMKPLPALMAGLLGLNAQLLYNDLFDSLKELLLAHVSHLYNTSWVMCRRYHPISCGCTALHSLSGKIGLFYQVCSVMSSPMTLQLA